MLSVTPGLGDKVTNDWCITTANRCVDSPRLPRNLVRSCLYLCVTIVISDTRAGGQGYK